MVEKKIVLPEIEELAPEPPPKGPIVWAKDNLFYSVSSTLLTIFGAAVAVLFVSGMFGFILEDERKWEAITTNMRLLMIQAYPHQRSVPPPTPVPRMTPKMTRAPAPPPSVASDNAKQLA